jgi:hypothetical protein
MERCGRCHRVKNVRFDDYPEILPAPPWSEAEARAALLLGTVVMDLPVRGPVQGAYSLPLDPLSDRVIGADASLWFDPVADRWQWRSSTGARAADREDGSSTSSPTPSRTWHH